MGEPTATHKLVKEIITTTTEKYNEDGKIKEKITEQREKIYSSMYSDDDIKNASVINQPLAPSQIPQKEVAPQQSPLTVVEGEKTKEQLILAAAQAVDASRSSQPQVQPNPFTPWSQTPQGQAQMSQLNIPGLTVPKATTAQGTPPKFPWEK